MMVLDLRAILLLRDNISFLLCMGITILIEGDISILAHSMGFVKEDMFKVERIYIILLLTINIKESIIKQVCSFSSVPASMVY